MAGNGYLRGDYETTVGYEGNTSPTLSTKSIYIPAQSANLDLNPSPLERDDELRGVDESIAVLEDIHRPTWNLSTRAYPDVTAFILKTALGAPTTTVGNGIITDANGVVVPTGAYRHTWTAPFGPSGASPQTTRWTGAWADQTVFARGHGCATESIEFGVPEAGGIGLQASGPLTYLDTALANPSLTPSYEALTIPPFLNKHLAITTDLTSESGAEGDLNFTLTNPVEAVKDLSYASGFPTKMYKADGPIGLTGSVTRSTISAAGWAALKAATGFALKFTVTSTAIIASTYPYKMIVTVGNAQYVSGGPNALESKRRIQGSFDWRAGYTGTAGNIAFQIVDATTSYV